jgi:riboflavin biosynthesis pyrimidine reductase
VRVLVGPDTDDLHELYAVPADRADGPWLRVNMVSSVDGAATGESGKSGSLNNAADKRVFDHLRSVADVIVVGAGTARVEGYRPTDRPIVAVSRRPELPETLRGGAPGSVELTSIDDPATFKRSLAERGWTNILCEGGPSLLGALLAAGVVDELCTTTVPLLVGGDYPRITHGPAYDVPLRLHSLLESDGTLLARWLAHTPTWG